MCVCLRSAVGRKAPASSRGHQELHNLVTRSTATNTTQQEITMSGIGANLPPHLLAKRKRQEEETTSDAPAPASGAKRSSSPDEPDKRRRVLGPAMPPAPLDERPSQPPNAQEEDSSDDDDDFGPSLPTEDAVTKTSNQDEEDGTQAAAATQQAPLKRDDWMMMPPTQDDLAARLDPTKQRPKAFNTGKGARGPNPAGEDSSTWHETPEQKQKRLQDEMMGISKASAPTKSGSTKSSKVKDEATRHKIQEHVRLHFPPAQQTSYSWHAQRLLIPHCRTRPVGLR